MRVPVQTIANLALQPEQTRGWEHGKCGNAVRRIDRSAAVNSPERAFARTSAAAPPRQSHHLLPQHPREFTTLCTPVIEMGVSNGVAVCADDLCEPIPALCASLSLRSSLSPLLSPFLFSPMALSLSLSSPFFPTADRKKARKKERKWRDARRERRFDLDCLPGK